MALGDDTHEREEGMKRKEEREGEEGGSIGR